MRVGVFVLATLTLSILTGCTQFLSQDTAKEARVRFAKCAADNKDMPEGRMISDRLWMGDGSDTTAKLLDPYPLTPTERAALIQLHGRAVQCRQIILADAEHNEAWQSPYLQDFVQRSDEIYQKLASGEVPVGIANKLSIENDRKLQADLAAGHVSERGHIDGIRREEARREQATDALLAESDQIASSQSASNAPRTYCSWLGNTLNCGSLR
jgi:hypothetical protein